MHFPARFASTLGWQ